MACLSVLHRSLATGLSLLQRHGEEIELKKMVTVAAKYKADAYATSLPRRGEAVQFLSVKQVQEYFKQSELNLNVQQVICY